MSQKRPAAITIDDLLQPRLSATQKAMVEYGNTSRVQLTVEAVLDKACRETGLDDFGDSGFRNRLQAQLYSAEEDPWLNGLGRMTIFNEKVLNAANRLRVTKVLKENPAIDATAIERPLIIVGLPRSGTTHLVNMIAADQRFRSLPYWESRQPVPEPGEPPNRDSSNPRYQNCAKAWEMQDSLLPLLKNMHAMNPDHIHEEIELQDMDFASYTLEWIANVPAWRDYYLSLDHRPHYLFLKRMLKLLSWYRGPQRWVLKSPQHLEQLPALSHTFPDATIVVTHRDPVQVIASAVTMLAYGSRLRNEIIHTREIARYWIDRIEKLLLACVRDRDIIDRKRSIDVLFPEFMADDMAMVRKIYKLADTKIDGQTQTALGNYLKANPRGRHGQIVYHLERDFGVNIAALRERFSFYYDRYPGLTD